MKPLILAADGQQDHEGLLRELFPPAKYEPCIIVPSASAARQLLPTRRFSMVVIFTPLHWGYNCSQMHMLQFLFFMSY